MEHDFIIVGGGLTGLNCARTLLQNGQDGIILEADSKIGGRIQTEIYEGYRLDHGFQVLQTGYPEAQNSLDLSNLQLISYPAGVVIRKEGRFHTIADPRHHLRHIFSTAFAPVGTIMDRFRMVRLARSVCSCSFEELFQEKEMATSTYLRECGFSENFIASFFTPFFAGACLDRSLSASSRILRYIFRVFAAGDASIPAHGMEAIPKQIADAIPAEKIHLHSRVTSVSKTSVTTVEGQIHEAKRIIIATERPAVDSLLSSSSPQASVGESCLYFTADWQPPFDKPFLVLNGETQGPINNLAFPSLVSPHYAPTGKTLIAAVVLGEDNIGTADLTDRVQKQCIDWFGRDAEKWSHLKTFTIRHALPDQQPPTADPYSATFTTDSGIYIAGEYNSLPGIQWALLSGRKTAEFILNQPVVI